MNNLMIDLETMGTSRNSMIISIGAVFFDPNTDELGAKFYVNIDWNSCVAAGLEMDPDTVKWWMKQDKSAVNAILEQGVFLGDALRDFTSWMKANTKGAVKPWGNGATFDVSLLENAYSAVGLAVPWSFYNVRDVRTVVDLATGIVDKRDIKFVGTAHNALDDAIHQAKYVSKMTIALTQ